MSDYILKAISADGQARAYVATTKDLVNEAARRHEMSPVAIVASGRLFTAGAMMGTMMKNDKDLLTVRIKGNGPIGQMAVTVDPNGHVKGFVGNPQVMLPLKDGRIDVAGALGIGVLSVTKDLGLKEPYIGDTILVTSEIGDDLTYYFATSEQTPSAVGLGVLMDKDNTAKDVGGFIVQMLPGASEETTGILEANIALIKSVSELLDKGETPEDILARIFNGIEYKILEKIDVSYKCDCSRNKVVKALLSLGADELEDLIEEGKPVETKCQFCGEKYEFGLDELQTLHDDLEGKRRAEEAFKKAKAAKEEADNEE